MNLGTVAPSGFGAVERRKLCTIRVPCENGSTIPLAVPFPAFNTLYVLQRGFFK
jgi:hypothetical protein